MVCFIILHYMAIEETILCINSIKESIHKEKKIIIVDNNSSNNSGVNLLNIYLKDKEVEVILNSENLGFAKGNNVGYLYAKKKWNPKFIIILNNDVKINQIDFWDKLNLIYEKEKFYILGPDIRSTTYDIHQSPKRLEHYTEEELIKIRKKICKLEKSKTLLLAKCFFKQSKILRKNLYKYRNFNKKINFNKKYYNVPIHGACLVFSELFIDKKEYAFYPHTFFYYETEILDYLCNEEGLKVVYDPKLYVLHQQNVSTNIVYKNIIDKTKFSYKCNKESIEIFIKLIQKNKRR